MPHHSLPLREDFLLCSICQDVFTDPVTTPCGHTFCKSCITDHWGPRVPCQCPTCRKVFTLAPYMEVSTVVSEMAAQFKQSAAQKVDCNNPENQAAKPGEVLHDILRGTMMKAVTSCLACLLCVFIVWMVLGPNTLGLVSLEEEYEGMKLEKLEAEGFIREMQQAISELKKRSSEIEQLSVTQQEFISKEIQKQMKRSLAEAALKRLQQYAVGLTLDPDTAHPYLILSDDGKQVHHGGVKQRVQKIHGFDKTVCVLSQQSFSSGRFYFEVQVKGKTCWTLGVAEESINRKGVITVSPQNGFWTIWLRNGNEYKARSDPPVRLSLQSGPEKVGVFVDYEEGLVSFYDVDTAALIYSFTRYSFTEKLYPYFGPCRNYRGRNSAPLVISPVRHTG